MKELLYLKDEQLMDLIEKLFISYREIFADSKNLTSEYIAPMINFTYNSGFNFSL